MKNVKLVVIIPVGPTTHTPYLLDTIESVKHYCGRSHKIILINDSQREIKLDRKQLNIDVIDTKHSMGKQSGLYFSICLGIKHALMKYNFDVLLRMDDDAVITGKEPEKEAIAYFLKHPDIGMIGSYRMTWENKIRDFSPPRNEILIETSFLWAIIKRIKGLKSNDIRQAVESAKSHGYQLGEHVFGGTYFMSRKLIEKLDLGVLIPDHRFEGSRLEEDHIFSLLTKSVGMNLGDFVTGSYPMCLKWRGMPTSVDKIYLLGKKVIHSTRFYKSQTEQDVRKQLRRFRNQ
jgi:glycosyltransferase involved in cell wall biosynthesis